MTKRYLWLTLLLIGVMILSGCSAKEAASNTADTNTAGAGGSLPELTELMLGTFQLEETDLAVTREQAKQLLPLWKMTRSLSDSDSTAQKELDAVASQIGDLMTKQQLDAISDMGLTFANMRTIMEEQGIEMAAGRGDVSEEEIATRMTQGGQAGGGPGGGVPGQQRPGGAQGMPEMDPDQLAALQAQRAAGRGMGLATNGPLYDALIKLLTERAASAT